MQSYHLVWLSVHPERTQEWLKERLRDGFHVHHVDGNHSNDEPKNLVLIESGDHMMLHNGSKRLLWRPPSGKKSPGRPRKVVAVKEIKAVKQIIVSPSRQPNPAPVTVQPAVKIKNIRAGVYLAAAERLRYLDSIKEPRITN